MFTSFNDVRMNNMKRIYEKYAVHSYQNQNSHNFFHILCLTFRKWVYYI